MSNIITYRASDKELKQINRIADELKVSRTFAIKMAIDLLDTYRRKQ